MPITVAATKNALASAYAALATHAGGHTDDPATSGNELAGAGYARGAISWGSPVDGVIEGTATITMPTAGGVLAAVGLWDDDAAGSLVDGQVDVSDITYAGAGTATVTVTYTQD